MEWDDTGRTVYHNTHPTHTWGRCFERDDDDERNGTERNGGEDAGTRIVKVLRVVFRLFVFERGGD